MSKKKVIKLMTVLAIFMSITEDSKQAILVSAKHLQQLTYIQYPIAFQIGLISDLISAFFNSNSEINVMHLIFAKKRGFMIQHTNVGIQKIYDTTTLKTQKIVVAVFLIIGQAEIVKFFKKTFLEVNISPNVIFRIFFFILSNIDVDFLKEKL